MPAKETANPVQKALWYIESHFRDEIGLDEAAAAAGVSRYHISRAFGLATGRSLMHYVRGRRLSEAARALAQGAPDILTVAIEAGYGSHEAFTRAFREQFDRTPESVRDDRSVNHLELVEAIKMNEELLANLQLPRFENGRTLLIAGLSERYNDETSANIPAQWQKFQPHFGHVPGQIGRVAYGVLCNSDDAGNTEYITGVEVADFGRVRRSIAAFEFRSGDTPCSRTASTFRPSAAYGPRCSTSGFRNRAAGLPRVRNSSATARRSIP